MSFSLNYYFWSFFSQLDSFLPLWWFTEDVEINCEWSSFIMSCRWMNTTVGSIKLEERSPITTPTFFQETVKIRWFLCFHLKSRGGWTNKLHELTRMIVKQKRTGVRKCVEWCSSAGWLFKIKGLILQERHLTTPPASLGAEQTKNKPWQQVRGRPLVLLLSEFELFYATKYCR